MIRIYTCRHPYEAPMILAHFESRGIMAVVQDEASAMTFGGLQVHGVGATIWVSQADADLARAALKEWQSDDDVSSQSCPRCGHGLSGFRGRQCPGCGGTLDVVESWVCPQCHEMLDAAFDACWNCGAIRPETSSESPGD